MALSSSSRGQPWLCCHIGQLETVMPLVGHFMRDDQIVPGIDCLLNVVANQATAATTGAYRVGGVVERDLDIGLLHN